MSNAANGRNRGSLARAAVWGSIILAAALFWSAIGTLVFAWLF